MVQARKAIDAGARFITQPLRQPLHAINKRSLSIADLICKSLPSIIKREGRRKRVRLKIRVKEYLLKYKKNQPEQKFYIFQPEFIRCRKVRMEKGIME